MKKLNIVITGASYGLGRALAIAFSRENAKIVLLARNFENLEKTRSLMKNPEHHSLFSTDISDVNQIIQTVAQIEQDFSHIDILINNAAAWNTGLIEEMQDEAIENQISSTVTGTILLTKYLLPLLQKSKNPHIINIISTVVTGNPKLPFDSSSTYIASKCGEAGFSESLRVELAPKKIKVTTFYPGWIATDSSLDDTIDQVHEKFGSNRMGVSDVVKAVQFCISCSQNGYIHSLVMQESEF